MSFHIDPRILQALQKAGEQMMKEARRRRTQPPPSSFAKDHLRTDLTTAQKMKVFKFIIALETAKEL